MILWAITIVGLLALHFVLPTQHQMIDWATRTVFWCGVLHTISPPWDWQPEYVTQGLTDFPRVQKWFFAIFHSRWYKLYVYTVGFVALHARSTLWRSISINNPNGVNFANGNGKGNSS